jgi:hypothetical protein
MAFDPSEWEVVEQKKPAFDPSEWEVVPATPPVSNPGFQESFANNLTAAANTAFPFADEGAAALRSILPGFQSYDAELEAIREGEREWSNDHPIQSGASSGVGLLASAPAMPSKVAQAPTIGAKALQAMYEGLGYGAYYGFGNGEGGAGERAKDALESGAMGAVAGPVAVGATAGLGKAIESGEEAFLKHALNLQRSDATKAAKFVAKGSEQTPLSDAITAVNKRGMFGLTDSADDLVVKNQDAVEGLGAEVSSILQAADSAQKNVVLPSTYPKAEAFIAKHPYEKDFLKAQLGQRLDTHNQEWDGTISGFNELKQGLYKKAYTNLAESPGLDRALASDMKDFIESETANLLGPAERARMIELNRQQGEHLTLRDLLAKGKNKEEMGGGGATILRRAVVSPLGGAAAGAAATMATGNPLPLLGAALGAGLSTRTGQMALSKTSGPLGRAMQAGANVPGGTAALSQLSAYLAGGGESESPGSPGMSDYPASPASPLIGADAGPGSQPGSPSGGDTAQGLPPQSSLSGMLRSLSSGDSASPVAGNQDSVGLLQQLMGAFSPAEAQAQQPPPQFPRSSQAIQQNPQAFIQAVAQISNGNPELMQDVQAVLSEPNEAKRDMAMMELTKMLPQLFEPTAYKSLWNGRIADPMEQKMYGDELRTRHRTKQIDANYMAQSLSALNADGTMLPPPAPVMPQTEYPVSMPTSSLDKPREYAY